MRLLFLIILVNFQFGFSQGNEIKNNTKLKGKEFLKRYNEVLDSLNVTFEAVANDSKISNLLVVENAKRDIGTYSFRINNKYAFGNFTDLKRIYDALGYNSLHTTIDEKIKGELFYVFYKGNLLDNLERNIFEKILLNKLKLEKVVKLQNFTTYKVSIINSLLIKSFEKDYKNVFDQKENKLYFSGKINQFINALNGFFPSKIFLVENSDEENLYDIEIDVSSLNKCLEELKFLGFVIEENNEMLEHTFINSKIK